MKLTALILNLTLYLVAQSRPHLMAVPPDDTVSLVTAASEVKSIQTQIDKLIKTRDTAEDHLCTLEKITRRKMGEGEGYCASDLHYSGFAYADSTGTKFTNLPRRSPEFSDDYKYLLRMDPVQ